MFRKILNISACLCAFGAIACSNESSAGVTEEGNPIALGESSSSVVGNSSAVSSSSNAVSSSSEVVATPRFDLWNGQTDIKIKTNSDETGYWFTFSDEAYGGMSQVSLPVAVGNSYSNECYAPVFEYCGGMCGTAELHNSENMPWAGVGFTLADENSTADVSSWGGVCVTYASEYALNVYLVVNVGDVDAFSDVSPLMTYPMITLPKTVNNEPTFKNMLNPEAVITRCAKWSDFRVSSWAEVNKAKLSKVYSGEEAAKEIKAIDFVLMGESEISGKFNITGISTYDEKLPQWRDGGMNEKDVGLETTDSDSLTCLWKGTDGTGIVKTGYNELDEFVGMLYTFDASPEGSYSRIEFPAYPGMEYEPYMYESVIMTCDGFCGTMEFSLKKADYAASAVAFNITEDSVVSCEGNTCYAESKFADIQSWGGICITYYSEKDAYLNVVVKDVPYDDSPKAPLPASGGFVEKCVAWDQFAPNVPNLGTAVSTIQFIVRSDIDGDQNQFNIVGIGKYSANGACAIQKPSYTPKSSSSARSSSSSTSSSSKTFKDECAFRDLDNLWYGPAGVLGIKTGYSNGGRWYAFVDNEKVEMAYPVPLANGKDSLEPVLEYCQGLCTTNKGVGYAGFGFDIAGKDENGKLKAVDVKHWGGLCVTYASQYDLNIAIVDGEQIDFANLSDNKRAALPQTGDKVMTECRFWDEFVDKDLNPVDPSKISSILFYSYAKNFNSSFNILGIGEYRDIYNLPYFKCSEPERFM